MSEYKLTLNPGDTLTVTVPAAVPVPEPTPTPAPVAGERKFPMNPLALGPMSATAWASLGGFNPSDPTKWSKVIDDAGRKVVEITHDPAAFADGHRNAGTGRDEVYGGTYAAAFGLKLRDAASFPALTGSEWCLVWQCQMTGSPMVAIEVPGSATAPKDDWYIRTRSSSGEQLRAITPFKYGQWEFFVVEYKLDNAAGYVKMWHATDRAPDVTATPTYSRTGFDTWQWPSTSDKAHETLGLYSSATVVRKPLLWPGYGRAATPARAVVLAGLP